MLVAVVLVAVAPDDARAYQFRCSSLHSPFPLPSPGCCAPSWCRGAHLHVPSTHQDTAHASR